MGIDVFRKAMARVYPPRRFFFYLQRAFLNAGFRERLALILCRRLPDAKFMHSEDCYNLYIKLEEEGYVNLPSIGTKKDVEEVVSWLKGKQVYDRWDKKRGLFSPSSPPPECHTAMFEEKDVVAAPHLMRWANHPLVLNVVSQALGCKPTLSNLAVWWSFPGHDKPQEAEYFHRDVDDIRFVKLFFYLTDVDEGSGPHVFIPGSHKDRRFREIRRYEDAEVISTFGDGCAKYFNGAAGTAFLENTFGLHKGLPPSHRPRLLFQAQYSMHPIGIYQYHPKKVVESSELEFDEYINRLYIER